jgi:hypothetical protein
MKGDALMTARTEGCGAQSLGAAGKDLLTKEEFVGNTTGISVMTIFWMIELDETEIEVPSPLPSAFAFH